MPIEPTPGFRSLNLEGEAALPILKALANETRMAILSLLSQDVMNVSELALALGIPHSTVNFISKWRAARCWRGRA